MEPLKEAGKLSALLLQLTPAFSPHEHRLEELEPLIERSRRTPSPSSCAIAAGSSPGALEDTLRWYEDANARPCRTGRAAGRRADDHAARRRRDPDDLAYCRLHGRDAEGYLNGRRSPSASARVYQPDELEEIGARVQELAGLATDTRVMFNNNRAADAPNSARAFRELLGISAGKRCA